MEQQQGALNCFRQLVWDFYTQHKRDFAWRSTDDSYAILVSELMLQQTQTHRVVQKYEDFLTTFPSFIALAQASLHDVLSVWQGLGYNRRGKYLHEIAKKVVNEYDGIVPQSPTILVTFPGIGIATASSICAFAFNQQTVFIETNIRAVFIHHFFQNVLDVQDKDIMPLVAATVDHANPREWYYALMDYGVYLKKSGPNPSRKSKHHVVQSKFEGSDRQIRGAIIRALVTHHELMHDALLALIAAELDTDTDRVCRIIDQLVNEDLLCQKKDALSIK